MLLYRKTSKFICSVKIEGKSLIITHPEAITLHYYITSQVITKAS